MKYTYQARNKEGKAETGTIEAHSKEAAAILLQKYNIFVTSLQEQKTKESFFKNIAVERKVSRKDLSIFFQQLSVMLSSRVPVMQSLSSLAAQTKKRNFKEMLSRISGLVEEGVPLSDAFGSYPKIFNGFYINLIRSGEASGNISGSLAYIAEHLEREDEIIAQLRHAMIYPILVLCVLFIVIGIIIVEVVPRISDLIKESNASPPLFTTLMLGAYEFLERYWWVLLTGAFFLAVAVAYYFSTKEGKKNFNRISLKIPLVGDLLKKVFLARFCSNISTLLVAGVSINKALQITEDTVNNVVYKNIIIDIGREVSEGEKMSSVMVKHSHYFPSFVVQMIKVGEETGKLDKTLAEIVNFYQKEVKRSIDIIATLIEPIMIIFLGAVVSMLAISVISPLYETLGNI